MTPASLSKLVTPVILGCLGALILSLTWAWAFSISCSTASIFPDTAVSWSTASLNCFLSASVLACNRIFLDMSARCSPVTRLYSWRLLLSCLAGDSSSCPLGGGIPASRNNLCASGSACSHKAAIASLYLSPLMERPGGEIISQSPSPVLCELRNWLAAWRSAARCADLLLLALLCLVGQCQLYSPTHSPVTLAAAISKIYRNTSTEGTMPGLFCRIYHLGLHPGEELTRLSEEPVMRS